MKTWWITDVNVTQPFLGGTQTIHIAFSHVPGAQITGDRTDVVELSEYNKLKEILSHFIPRGVAEMSAHDVLASGWNPSVTGAQMLHARDALKETT